MLEINPSVVTLFIAIISSNAVAIHWQSSSLQVYSIYIVILSWYCISGIHTDVIEAFMLSKRLECSFFLVSRHHPFFHHS